MSYNNFSIFKSFLKKLDSDDVDDISYVLMVLEKDYNNKKSELSEVEKEIYLDMIDLAEKAKVFHFPSYYQEMQKRIIARLS